MNKMSFVTVIACLASISIVMQGKFYTFFILWKRISKTGANVAQGQSNSQIANKMTTPWLTKEKKKDKQLYTRHNIEN